MAPPSPVLCDDIFEAILIRFPPDEPAGLVHAALVCKPWCRLISGRRFRCRYRKFHHRTDPILGFLYNSDRARFLPSSSSSFCLPYGDDDLCDLDVIDTGHGLILLHNPYLDQLGHIVGHDFVVWDPITDEWTALPSLPGSSKFGAAVVCAARKTRSCDHLGCHGGPILVVFVGTTGSYLGEEEEEDEGNCFVRVYSSEDDSWSQPIYSTVPPPRIDKIVPSALVGNSIHFLFQYCKTIFKYNLVTGEISCIPRPVSLYDANVALRATEDGSLELAIVKRCKLCLWSRDEAAGWACRRVIELAKLLPSTAITTNPYAIGAANGIAIIFLQTNDGIFTINLNSGQATKICGVFLYNIFAYISLCTPVLRLTSKIESAIASSP